MNSLDEKNIDFLYESPADGLLGFKIGMVWK